jgi:bifunctional UDP-N-acetylglucosamine pyrophosphorylase/glucosamine-1-phosphate N-acetyltransferase
LRAPLAARRRVAVLGFRPADPAGYGRLIMKGTELIAIREEADASASERRSPVQRRHHGARGRSALAILERIGNDNRKGEFYLTDAVEIARGMKLRAVAVEVEEDDVRGINTKASSPKPKPWRSSGCARPRSTPASRWSRRRRCF